LEIILNKNEIDRNSYFILFNDDYYWCDIFKTDHKKLWWKLIEDIHINESDPQKILILENEFKMIHRKQKLERILI